MQTTPKAALFSANRLMVESLASNLAIWTGRNNRRRKQFTMALNLRSNALFRYSNETQLHCWLSLRFEIVLFHTTSSKVARTSARVLLLGNSALLKSKHSSDNETEASTEARGCAIVAAHSLER